MGQAPTSCISRDKVGIPEDEVDRIPFTFPSTSDHPTSLPDEVQLLSSRVETLLDSMQMLQLENERLQQMNTGLQKDNSKLKVVIEEQQTQRAWRTFDIVEQHYKQLERHRQRRLSGETNPPEGAGDADSTQGASNQTSPRLTPRFDELGGVTARSMATPRLICPGDSPLSERLKEAELMPTASPRPEKEPAALPHAGSLQSMVSSKTDGPGSPIASLISPKSGMEASGSPVRGSVAIQVKDQSHVVPRLSNLSGVTAMLPVAATAATS